MGRAILQLPPDLLVRFRPQVFTKLLSYYNKGARRIAIDELREQANLNKVG
jgi:hypothetical protein